MQVEAPEAPDHEASVGSHCEPVEPDGFLGNQPLRQRDRGSHVGSRLAAVDASLQGRTAGTTQDLVGRAGAHGERTKSETAE